MSKKSKSAPKQSDKKLLILGSVMLVASLPVYIFLGVLIQALCPKTEYGGCTLGSALGAGVLMNIFMTLWIIVAIIIFFFGLYRYGKSTPTY
jgi:uncharacterized membrane protein